ncbi:hypothetical protein ACSRUE_01455 [Sorangium sp. KYC3313]|uniref:hypothetical protein n=1 Tax=Sorangium sp. KYC3313 TaxID=3449740 RepID=UPI003F8CD698
MGTDYTAQLAAARAAVAKAEQDERESAAEVKDREVRLGWAEEAHSDPAKRSGDITAERVACAVIDGRNQLHVARRRHRETTASLDEARAELTRLEETGSRPN